MYFRPSRAVVALWLGAIVIAAIAVDFDHGEIKGTQEGVLGALGIAEELGEVNDPGHVGLGEFNNHLLAEGRGHGGHSGCLGWGSIAKRLFSDSLET